MKKILIPIAIFFTFISCQEKFPVLDSWGSSNYNLVNQDGEKVIFPHALKGKVSLVTYIFTNCPDICPLTTNNMRLIQERMKKEGINHVDLYSISFDPEVDTPPVLKKFAEMRDLNLSNWQFLTGDKKEIDDLIHQIGVFAVKGDSTVFEDSKTIYYYIHTDRISLVDKEGKIRKNYPGSTTNIDEVINDLKDFNE